MDANNNKRVGARRLDFAGFKQLTGIEGGPGECEPSGPHGTIARRRHGGDTWHYA